MPPALGSGWRTPRWRSRSCSTEPLLSCWPRQKLATSSSTSASRSGKRSVKGLRRRRRGGVGGRTPLLALATPISWGGQQGAGGRRDAGPSHFGSWGSDLTLPLACGSVDLKPSDLRPPASRDLCPTVLRRSSDGAPTRSIASSSAIDSTNMPSSTMRCSSRFSSPLETAHDHFRSTCSRRASPRQCRCKLVTAVCWRGDSAGGSPPASVLIVAAATAAW